MLLVLLVVLAGWIYPLSLFDLVLVSEPDLPKLNQLFTVLPALVSQLSSFLVVPEELVVSSSPPRPSHPNTFSTTVFTPLVNESPISPKEIEPICILDKLPVIP